MLLQCRWNLVAVKIRMRMRVSFGSAQQNGLLLALRQPDISPQVVKPELSALW